MTGNVWLCFAGTSSVEDKLDADGRSIWIGNVCLVLSLCHYYVMSNVNVMSLILVIFVIGI